MPDLTRRQVALVVAVVLGVATVALGLYGLLTGPRHDQPTSSTVVVQSRPLPHTPAGFPAGRDPGAQRLPRTQNALAYARAVAAILFDWDAAAGYGPADYQAPVLADADPSSEETPGLINDVATYLPTTEQWMDLATMNVSQTLTIESAEIPKRWRAITAHAHGELRPGTVAVTITGTRNRTGIWDGEHRTTTSPVAFTIFVACRPTFERCHVLRLSQLDNPLR